jgi:MoxR-like ATPase
MQRLTRMMPISDEVKSHAIDIVRSTRPEGGKIAKQYLDYGASPRASIGIILAAKARALINGRNYVSKEDVEKIAMPVLRHRLILNFEAERNGIKPDDVVAQIIKGL